MDRNGVIAIVLITLIMMVWMYWLAPAPPDPPPASDPERAEELQPLPEADDIRPDEPAPEERPTTPDMVAGAPLEGVDRLITVETDLYTAVFSSRGATLKSFVLKEFRKFDQATPVQIVDTTLGGAVGLSFTTPTNHVVDTRSLYFEPVDFDAEHFVVTDDNRHLTFELPIGDGVIRKTYAFLPDEYEINLEVHQENSPSFATGGEYEIVWYGGIPFTEGDPEDEARISGAYARSGGVVESINLEQRPEEFLRLTGDVEWGAVKNKFFTSVIMPQQPTIGADLDGERLAEINGVPLAEDYTVRLLLRHPAAGTDHFRMYLGPMEYYRINAYGVGLYDMVDFGWGFFDWMTRPLARYAIIPSFHFLSQFIPNYGVIIIVFALLVKLIFYPLTKSSFTSIARMRELQPQMEAIKEKHKDDPQKQQQAMMKMYKDSGVNPLGGCLPLLLQWPIIIALWQFFPSSIEIRQQSFLWANDLSAPDVILDLPFTIPLYGGFVAGFTLLMGISMVFQMRLQSSAMASNPQMKMLQYIFPVMIFVIFNRLAAGLNLYYLLYNVLTAAQQKWINHQLDKKGGTTPVSADVNGSDKDGRKKGGKVAQRRKSGTKAGSKSRQKSRSVKKAKS